MAILPVTVEMPHNAMTVQRTRDRDKRTSDKDGDENPGLVDLRRLTGVYAEHAADKARLQTRAVPFSVDPTAGVGAQIGEAPYRSALWVNRVAFSCRSNGPVHPSDLLHGDSSGQRLASFGWRAVVISVADESGGSPE
ncbi:hypothetical protein AB0O14_00175 [Microbacterium foliorum]